jgi:hypothetical protein
MLAVLAEPGKGRQFSGAMETIAMGTEDFVVIAIMAVAAGAGIAFSVKSEPDYCPQPSAASVATLFAPCQAFESAIGHGITKKEAVQMGLLTPDEQPEPPATQVAAGEHATVGSASIAAALI